MDEDMKEVLKMFIKHIRPDGELYPFSYFERQDLMKVLENWSENKEQGE